MAGSKYDKCFISDPVTDGQYIKKRLVYYAFDHYPGVNYWIRSNYFTKDHTFGDPPHAHDFDQIFHFIGGDPYDITDFDAEVEFHLGGEKHIFDRMTLVYVPKGVNHCPIYVRKVKKPVLFFNVALTDHYDRVGGQTPPHLTHEGLPMRGKP